jgi:beta-galactosidase
MLGLRVEEFAPYAETQTNLILTQDGQHFGCRLWTDVIQLHGAEALAAYEHDYYAASPAVTRNQFGKGLCFYVGTLLEKDGLAWLLDHALQAGKVTVHPSPAPGVELVRRHNGAQTWLFALDHSAEAVDVPLDTPGDELLSGRRLNGTLRLGPTDVAIIQFPASP